MSTHTDKWPAGTPCWVDLTSSDPDGARAFYAELFGWDLQVGAEETGHYTTALKNDRPVAGINGMAAQGGMPSVWVTYLATDDLDATWATAKAAGAQEIMAPMDVMTQGRMGLAVDPVGAFFGMWQAGEHTGSQVVDEPGSLIWNELMTRDYEGAKSFYGTVFGHTFEAVDMPPEFQYSTFNVGEQMAGGVGTMPEDVPSEVPSNWGVYFKAESTDDAVASVTRLGGSVIRPPMDTPYGRMATVSDPQGATFSIMAANQE